MRPQGRRLDRVLPEHGLAGAPAAGFRTRPAPGTSQLRPARRARSGERMCGGPDGRRPAGNHRRLPFLTGRAPLHPPRQFFKEFAALDAIRHHHGSRYEFCDLRMEIRFPGTTIASGFLRAPDHGSPERIRQGACPCGVASDRMRRNIRPRLRRFHSIRDLRHALFAVQSICKKAWPPKRQGKPIAGTDRTGTDRLRANCPRTRIRIQRTRRNNPIQTQGNRVWL